MSYNVAPNVALTVRRGVRSHTRDHVERPPDPARRIPGCGSRKNNDGTGAVPSGRGVSTLVLAGDRGNEVRAYPRTVGIIETRVFVVIELTRMPSRHDARPRAGRRGRAARRVRRCRATRDLCSSMCSHPRPHRAPARLTRQRSKPTQPQSPHHHNSDSRSLPPIEFGNTTETTRAATLELSPPRRAPPRLCGKRGETASGFPQAQLRRRARRRVPAAPPRHSTPRTQLGPHSHRWPPC